MMIYMGKNFQARRMKNGTRTGRKKGERRKRRKGISPRGHQKVRTFSRRADVRYK
jgi:hypothetical protein